MNAATGRVIGANDDRDGAQPVTVLTDRVRRAWFSGVPNVVGRTIVVTGRPVTIVGIVPSTFIGTQVGGPPDVFLPMTSARQLLAGLNGGALFEGRPDASLVAWLFLIGRLTHGGTAARGTAEVRALFDARLNAEAIPLEEAALSLQSRDEVARFATLLGVAVSLVLLVGCANLAGLFLARVNERRVELAVRTALGAGRLRLVRHLFAETAIIAGFGGGAALVVAAWLMRLLTVFELPGSISISSLRAGIDVRLAVAATALTASAALLCGIAPLLAAFSTDVLPALKRQAGVSRGFRTSRWLVGTQVALSLVLVFGAGLFLRTLTKALALDLGFEADGLIAFRAGPISDVDRDGRQRQAEELVRQLRETPGIVSAALGPSPLIGLDAGTRAYRVDGVQHRPRQGSSMADSQTLYLDFIGGDYFSTLGQPLLAGREFSAAELAGRSPVAIVTRAAAERLWPGMSPIGHHIGFQPLADDLQVIGVVRDVRHLDLRDEGRMVVYVPSPLRPFPSTSLIVRSAAQPEEAVAVIRAVAGRVDPELRVAQVDVLDDRVAVLLMPQRLGASLLALLGTTALALMVVGTYGLVASVVARSTKEIGIRTALGATPVDVTSALARRVVMPVTVGLAIGASTCLYAGRFADRFMYEMSGSDPATLAAAALLLLTAAVIAALIPTRRACRIDPVEALRAE